MYSPETMERMERAIKGVPPITEAMTNVAERAQEGTEALDAWPIPAVRFPGVTVRLSGENGNGFSIVSRVRSALERHMRDELGEDRYAARCAGEAFFDEALSGDYDHLLATVMEWVNVE